MDVVNPSGGSALPKWDGAEPMFLDKLPDAKRALPALIVTKPDAGIPLTLKGNALIVKLDEKRGPYRFLLPDENFLTRWWVNGKPFIPSGASTIQGRAWSGHPSAVKEMHFIVAFHPGGSRCQRRRLPWACNSSSVHGAGTMPTCGKMWSQADALREAARRAGAQTHRPPHEPHRVHLLRRPEGICRALMMGLHCMPAVGTCRLCGGG